jgi:hypothetical protein
MGVSAGVPFSLAVAATADAIVWFVLGAVGRNATASW